MSKPHPLDWLIEPLVEEASFLRRPMFGCVGCYLHGKMVAVLAAKEEPWCGLLVPVERDQHDAIQADFPALLQHPVLPKWFYLPESHEDFEPLAEAIIELIQNEDPRFGVIPSPKKRSGSRSKS
jgi:hypothetical protein